MEISKKLVLGNLIINKPEEWEKDEILFEIKNYDYDSAKISMQDLKILYDYIGEILKTQ